MLDKIYGLGVHPSKELLDEYKPTAPDGDWRGILDAVAWGKSQNLFCYFTAVASGEKHRLSVFNRSDYKPYQGEVSFRTAKLGQAFDIKTETSSNGLPKFLKATPF